MRLILLILAVLTFALSAICELGLAYPVPGWLYLTLATAFAALLLPPMKQARARARRVALGGVVGAITTLYLVDWSSRKPFLRDLNHIQVGMTESEVRHRMRSYLEGTGWPASPFRNFTDSEAALTNFNLHSNRPAGAPTEELTIRDSLVFRHSNAGAFNSDWGIISLSNGFVTKVTFSPD